MSAPLKQFILSPLAEADIDSIAEYLARQSIETALRFYECAWETLHGISSFPTMVMYTSSPPLLKAARTWPVAGFQSILIFYVPDTAGIRLLRVLHAARDLPTIPG